MDPRYLLISTKTPHVVKSSLERFINYKIINYFSSVGNAIKNKFDIRFQYLVYNIIHTCNINDNRVFEVKLVSISELYHIPFCK